MTKQAQNPKAQTGRLTDGGGAAGGGRLRQALGLEAWDFFGSWELVFGAFPGQCFGRSRIAFLVVPSTSTLWVSTPGSSLSALLMMRRSKAFIGSSSTMSPQRRTFSAASFAFFTSASRAEAR